MIILYQIVQKYQENNEKDVKIDVEVKMIAKEKEIFTLIFPNRVI